MEELPTGESRWDIEHGQRTLRTHPYTPATAATVWHRGLLCPIHESDETQRSERFPLAGLILTAGRCEATAAPEDFVQAVSATRARSRSPTHPTRLRARPWPRPPKHCAPRCRRSSRCPARTGPLCLPSARRRRPPRLRATRPVINAAATGTGGRSGRAEAGAGGVPEGWGLYLGPVRTHSWEAW